MKIIYSSKVQESECTSSKEAQKLFGGDTKKARKLLKTIDYIKSADKMIDIIRMPPLHFHALKNKDGQDLNGYFAVDIDGRDSPWRLILQLLDKSGNPFDPCEIDKIVDSVKIIKIKEISNHYG